MRDAPRTLPLGNRQKECSVREMEERKLGPATETGIGVLAEGDTGRESRVRRDDRSARARERETGERESERRSGTSVNLKLNERAEHDRVTVGNQ